MWPSYKNNYKIKPFQCWKNRVTIIYYFIYNEIIYRLNLFVLENK